MPTEPICGSGRMPFAGGLLCAQSYTYGTWQCRP